MLTRRVSSKINSAVYLFCIFAANLLWSSCAKTPTSFNSVAQRPHIDSIQPKMGEPGSHVTIHGGVFSLVTEENKVSFNHKSATILSGTDSTLIAVVPQDAGSGPVTISVENRPGTDSVLFTYVIPPPSIISVSPLSGAVGTEITITGKNFSSTSSKDTVVISGIQANVISATTTQIMASIPDKVTSGPVAVTVHGNTSNSVNFDVKFSITGYSSACGVWADTLRINGYLGNNLSRVIFLNNYSVQPLSVSINNYATVIVPQTTVFTDIGQAYPIQITDDNGNSISGSNFTIIRPFRVDSASASLSITNFATGYNLTAYGDFTGYSDIYQVVNVYVDGTRLSDTTNVVIVNNSTITASFPVSMVNTAGTNTVKVGIACKSQSVNLKLQ